MCEHVNWDVRIDLNYFCTLLSGTKVLPLTMEVPDLIKIGEILKKMLVGCCLKKKKAEQKMASRLWCPAVHRSAAKI